MNYKVEFTKKILNYIYEGLFASLVTVFFIMVFLKEKIGFIDVLCVIVSFGLSYIIRDFSKNYISVLLFHIAEILVCMFIPISNSLKFLIAIMVLFYLLPNSMSYINRNYKLKHLDDAPWPSVLFGIIIYIFGIGMKSNFLINFSYISVVTMLMLYLLMLYCDGILKYMEESSNVSGLPVKDILLVNSKIVIFITLLLSAVMLLGRFLDFSKLYDILYNFVATIIRAIATFFMLFFNLLSSIISSGAYSTENTGVASDTENISVNDGIGSSLEIILVIFVVLLFLFVVYKILARIFKVLLTTKKFENDIVNDAVIEKKDINESRIENIKRKIFLTKEERARNIYKKTICAHKDDIHLTASLTCQDIRQDIYEKNVGDVDDLTSLYEEIRYGKKTVDDSVIKKMSRFSKNDKRSNNM